MMKATALLCCLLLPTLCAAQEPSSRWEAGGFFTYVFFERIGNRDAGVGTGAGGLGGRLVYRLVPLMDVDGEVIIHPNAGVSGSRVQAFVGPKVGKRFRRIGLFVKARPGFLYFRKDPFGVTEPGSNLLMTNWATSMNLSGDVGGVLEIYSMRGPIFRFDLSDTIVRYQTRALRTSQFEPLRTVGGFTTHNRQWSLGLSFPLR